MYSKIVIRGSAAFLGWAVLVIIMMVACNVHAQPVYTPTGKVFTCAPHTWEEVEFAKVDTQFKLYGWTQMKYTIYPVYIGSRGGLFTYRANKAGVMTKYYLTDEQKAKMTRE